jgi:porin
VLEIDPTTEDIVCIPGPGVEFLPPRHVSRGLFADRPLDITSLGCVRTNINPQFQFQLEQSGLPIQTSEQLVELNYAFQLTPSLFFRPGVQYDIRPGATSTHPNTWVFAFHVQLTL